MKKISAGLALAMLLSGCASFEPNFKDGKEYVGNFPVLYKGTVDDIQYQDKSGTVHSYAKEASDSLATGAGSFGNIASMTTGISSFGGGLAVGLIGVVADLVASNTPSMPPQIIVRKDNGEVISLAAPPHLLERAVKFNCLNVGEPVKVVDDGQSYLYLMHEDPRLQRRSALEPSCETLREKYNVPLRLAQTHN